jgi:hypothetical protein
LSFTQTFTVNCALLAFTSPNYLIAQTGAVGGHLSITTNISAVTTLGGYTPSGAVFSAGVLSVTNAPAGTGGAFPLSFSAGTIENSTSVNAGQNFTLYLFDPPQITSASSVNFTEGSANSFAVTASGYPKSPLALGGTNYSGMTFTVNGLPAGLSASWQNAQGQNTGTLILSGTPSSAIAGPHTVMLTANNGVGTAATQTFTLHVVTPGDVNSDGVVSCSDISVVKAALGTFIGVAGYDNRADLNADGLVDLRDLAFVASHLPAATKCP